MLTRLHRTAARLLLRTVSTSDPWRRFPYPVPLARYGMGAQRDFSWYFERGTDVSVGSLEDVAAWLRGCAYVRDDELFGRPDVWQHPSDFERQRAGDCEDFALWTWRKLVELGHAAELVVGRRVGACCPGHAWVLVRDGAQARLIDPVAPDADRMIRTLDGARGHYLPEASVDHRFARYVYAGYLERRRSAVGAPGVVPAATIVRA